LAEFGKNPWAGRGFRGVFSASYTGNIGSVGRRGKFAASC
jgi:hypothetical protein